MNQVQEISPLDLSKRLQDAQQPDEIGKLITIFNGMLSRIESAFSLQRTFVANVSHELKNPLTKVTSQLEVTLLKDRDQEEYKKLIESVLEDIRELNQLSNSLLELARLSRDEGSFTMTRVRLDEIFWEVRENVLQTDPTYQILFEIEKMPEDETGLYVNGNTHLLKTAIRNVIENACKFSPERKAWVSLHCDHNILSLHIRDNGPGIAEEDLGRVFQPFYRADATSKTKGYGIGLSLSQRIISMHKGSLTVESKVGEGTLVKIAFVTEF
jgi:signal transduction histidine kinase